jgi:hypothetical protein
MNQDQLEHIGPFAWPGAYPNFFLDKDNSTLCYACALADVTEDEPHVFAPIVYGGYLEGESMPENDDDELPTTCDQCGKFIDPAFNA